VAICFLPTKPLKHQKSIEFITQILTSAWLKYKQPHFNKISTVFNLDGIFQSIVLQEGNTISVKLIIDFYVLRFASSSQYLTFYKEFSGVQMLFF
jgi:hypothetical protein